MRSLFSYGLTLDEAEELIKNGADVNAVDGYGKTPLHYIRDIDIARLLIENNANINARNRFGITPIFYVQSLEMAKLFLSHGADLNAQGHDGLNVLFYVSDIDLIDLYIRNGIDVNIIDNEGHIPLYYYSTLKNKAIVNLLVNAGANLNIKSDNGSVLSIIHQYTDMDKSYPKFFIDHGAVASEIDIYHVYRELFTHEQQKSFDSFLLLTNDDDQFFHMCLAYQEGIQNNVEIDVRDMDIL